MSSENFKKEWIAQDKMFVWLLESTDEFSLKRRLSIWLFQVVGLSASRIAEIIGISKQAVWLWNRDYNLKGPKSITRRGRGGRNWAFLTIEQEKSIINFFINKSHQGQKVKPIVIKQKIEQVLERKVSMPYVYRLLKRHNWYEKVMKYDPEKIKSHPEINFESISRPWKRNI